MSTQNLADEHTLADGPPAIEHKCLEYSYTKLGRQTYFGQWSPWVIKNRCLEYCYTKLGRQTFFGQWHPGTRAEMTCISLQKNLADEPTLADGPPIPEQRWLAYYYKKLGRWTYFGWTQWQRFESSSIHPFWDTLLHFLKTHFCLESGFLSFLELQKSLLASFQGCWTQWQKFESSSIHCFWDTPLHFLETYFA